tara:strand:- start:191 stop:682 length:492 start_codon:yes stop_codon:yes gene_type:complete
MIILVIGECGVGKTWIMKQLIKNSKGFKIGLNYFNETDKNIVVGKYDNSTFEGSDKLSMAVMKDLDKMINYINKVNKTAIFEGDRFMNKNFIKKANPYIIKIKGDGKGGRLKRGSQQTERQLKTIKTRVKNIQAHKEVENSNECLNIIQTYENIKIKTSRTQY